MANGIPLDLGVGDLEGYLETKQGDQGSVSCSILVGFSTAPPFRQLVRGCPSSPGDGEKITLFYCGVLLIIIAFYYLTYNRVWGLRNT